MSETINAVWHNIAYSSVKSLVEQNSNIELRKNMAYAIYFCEHFRTDHLVVRPHSSILLHKISSIYFRKHKIIFAFFYNFSALRWCRGLKCPLKADKIITTIAGLAVQRARASTVRVFWPGLWFSDKMPSYQYRKSHCGDKTVVRSSYLHNRISYTGKMASWYWISPQALLYYSGCSTTRVQWI